jgi:ribulose-5-phosphate 4-epimerase/fuculose-1-phosphate aldolase
MRLALASGAESPEAAELARAVSLRLLELGHELLADTNQAELVLHAASLERPSGNYMRAHGTVFVVTFFVSPSGVDWADMEQLQQQTYRLLVQSLSNVVVHQVDAGPDGAAVYTMTPELGFRSHQAGAQLPQRLAEFIAPLAGARLVIENRLEQDLEPELCEPSGAALELIDHGRRLAALNLLPSVFDLSSVLSTRDLRLVQKLFGLRQLSYGNLSCRHDRRRFWMSGRGVDKGAMQRIGRDLLLVKGYDSATGEIVVSVPRGSDPAARVSVDAIEHFKLYQRLPEVGAIVHVHAWLEGVNATTQSWPCGSEALADEVLELVLQQPDPTRAIVGLRNHGLTITGPSLAEIFERIDGKLIQNIPALVS